MYRTLGILLWASAAPAFAQICLHTGGQYTGINYELTLSNAEVVGQTADGVELIRVVLSVSNISGDPQLNANTIGSDAVFGSNGVLHHDQAGFGTIATPTLDSIVALGQGGSAVDSHYLAPVRLPNPAVPPTEDALFDLGAADTGIDSVFPPIPPFTPAGVTGFGAAIRGGFAFGTAASPAGVTTDLIQLVTPIARITPIDFSFTIGNPDPSVMGEHFSGVIFCIPEPTTAALAGLAFLFVAGGRRPLAARGFRSSELLPAYGSHRE